jgi:hypothetical protein
MMDDFQKTRPLRAAVARFLFAQILVLRGRGAV